MTLIDLLNQAQGGRAMANLGRQFGLDDAQAEQAVRQLLPVISSGLKRNTGNEDGLMSLVNALETGNHEQYYEKFDADALPQMQSTGNGILGNILGSKDISRAAADRAAASTGIGSAVLKQMLPVIASMVMGALANRTRQPDFQDSLGGALGIPGGGAGGGLGSILGSVLSGALSGGAKRGSGAVTGSDIFGSLLDADGDGSVADDIFEMVGKLVR